MTIKRAWTDETASPLGRFSRREPLVQGHVERFKRVAKRDAAGAGIETQHSLTILNDPPRVKEATFITDEAGLSVVRTQAFEGEEAIRGRFGSEGDSLYSLDPMTWCESGPFSLSYEPALTSQSKK